MICYCGKACSLAVTFSSFFSDLSLFGSPVLPTASLLCRPWLCLFAHHTWTCEAVLQTTALQAAEPVQLNSGAPASSLRAGHCARCCEQARSMQKAQGPAFQRLRVKGKERATGTEVTNTRQAE